MTRRLLYERVYQGQGVSMFYGVRECPFVYNVFFYNRQTLFYPYLTITKKKKLLPFPPNVGITCIRIWSLPIDHFEVIWNLWLEVQGASEQVGVGPERDICTARGGQAQFRCHNGVLHKFAHLVGGTIQSSSFYLFKHIILDFITL